MLNEISHSVLRVFASYLLLLVLTRAMGRKLISQMTFFDFVVGVTVGSVVVNISVNQKRAVTSGITVLLALTAFTVAIDYLNMKTFFSRKLTNSEPVTIIENGKIVVENLTKVRLTLDNLMMLLREQSVFNISDVEFAIFETNGKLSVLKKSQKQPVTPSDLNIQTKYSGLTRDIIIDGRVMEENLTGANLDKNWLLDKLKENNLHKVENIFYAGLDTLGNLYISSNSSKRSEEKHGQHGIE